MSFSDEEILEGARAIRPHLGKLLGAEAERVEELLVKYLDQARSGKKVGNLISELMAEHDATREWMQDFLTLDRQQESTRSYSGLPGFPQNTPPMQRYACPECDHIWFRRSLGEKIPACPVHHRQLVLVK